MRQRMGRHVCGRRFKLANTGVVARSDSELKAQAPNQRYLRLRLCPAGTGDEAELERSPLEERSRTRWRHPGARLFTPYTVLCRRCGLQAGERWPSPGLSRLCFGTSFCLSGKPRPFGGHRGPPRRCNIYCVRSRIRAERVLVCGIQLPPRA